MLTGHSGEKKTWQKLRETYDNIPIHAVREYIASCERCLEKRKRKETAAGTVVKPILVTDLNQRSQVDLVDMQSMKDGSFKWILHYQEHLSKFHILRPLTSKTATEVARELLLIFLDFGAPRVLQSDNGREFTAQVIAELASIWSDLVLVNGRPRHPQSQGSVERSNSSMKNKLVAWMRDNSCPNWTLGIRFVQWQLNTCVSESTGKEPFRVMFGKKPCLGLSTTLPSEFLRKISPGILEEDLIDILEATPDLIETEPVISGFMQTVEPVTVESVTRSSETDGSVTRSSETEEPVTRSSETEEHVTRSCETEEHVTRSSETEEPVTRSSETEEPVTRSSETEEHVTRSCETEEHVTRSSETEEPVTRSSETEEHVTRSSETEEPVTKSSETEEHVTRSSETEEHVTRSSETEEPVTRSSETEEPVTRSSESLEPLTRSSKAVEPVTWGTGGSVTGGSAESVPVTEGEFEQDDFHTVRRVAADNLKKQGDRMLKRSQAKLKPIKVGDNVLVHVSEFDRGRADPANLIGVVLEEKCDQFKIGTKAGILSGYFARNQVEQIRYKGLSMDQIPVSESNVSVRAAVRLLSVGDGQGYKRCLCAGTCLTKRCKCLKSGMICNSACHPKGIACKNIETN